ncbi:fimbria/pilus periplasmic chaperone [Ralstonia pickettii]|uniref:Fimbria/pilus periplasmic chaperone n=1 Tax=Ralstonia pickettii TaxID=329 RepID=A0A7X2L8V4_RALPI|nr:molecular chaperone [Ralstonia pickettii]MRS97251.1 fimbria/pilus periplasmic chaperone [Ralstonia pickettii]
MLRVATAGIAFLIAALAPWSATAASLQISPIRIDLPPGQAAAVLTLRNRGTLPLNAQVRVFRWTQDAEGEHLEPAAALVASPPIVQIPADSEQLVRVVLTQPPTADAGEQAYRLLIDELPDRRPQTLTGVTMQLRYSVPVFVNAVADSPPRLSATLRGNGDKTVLVVRNADVRHAQLSSVSIEWSDGTHSEITAGLLGYALAGATRTWPVAAGQAAKTTPRRLRALVNGVAVEMPLARAD